MPILYVWKDGKVFLYILQLITPYLKLVITPGSRKHYVVMQRN